MTIFFGTDGIRGIANKGAITPEIALKLGSAAGTIFTKGSHRHLVVIGKDTRLSGYLLEPALTSGFIAVGMDVLLVGPMPTPAISMLTKSLKADIGIMISASHNPHQYNGIKIFDSKGIKLDKKTERDIEKLILEYPNNIALASPEKLGKATRLDDAPGRYIEFAKSTFPKSKTLSGIKIVIDSANGAAYQVARKIFWELGAEVIDIGNNPDGFNINQDCGSTHPEYVRKATIEHKADIGIALDGDADRVILVDEKGNTIDGDKILATIAVYMKSKNQLNRNTVIATHMSNIGLEKYLSANGIELIRTDIGDKHVSKVMIDQNYNLGGEQSGHIILSEFAATGDGIIAALQVLASFVCSKCKTISELCHKYTPVPQVLHNIKYNPDKKNILEEPSIKQKIKQIEARLDENSRLLIRKSGTEPVIRIMLESQNQSIVDDLIESIKSECNMPHFC
jgi:phosphoglucosamine mutase